MSAVELSPKTATPPVSRMANTLLGIDGDVFRSAFNRRPFVISHQLVDHPLLTLPSLIKLSKRLPESNVRYNRADVSVAEEVYSAPKTGLSVQETIRQIEECGSWMVLRFIEQDPEYRALVDQCLDEVQPLCDQVAPGMCKRQGFIFVTSPGGTTPFHMDPEYNFLLQIRGKKTANLFDVNDRSIVSEQELEDFLSGESFKKTYRSEYQDKAFVFEMRPGEGLHFPLNWPHWVKNGDEVSISLSITFRTPESERTSMVYNVNHHLRKRGFSPRPYGGSTLRDAAKSYAYRATRRAKKLFRSMEEDAERY